MQTFYHTEDDVFIILLRLVASLFCIGLIVGGIQEFGKSFLRLIAVGLRWLLSTWVGMIAVTALALWVVVKMFV